MRIKYTGEKWPHGVWVEGPVLALVTAGGRLAEGHVEGSGVKYSPFTIRKTVGGRFAVVSRDGLTIYSIHHDYDSAVYFLTHKPTRSHTC